MLHNLGSTVKDRGSDSVSIAAMYRHHFRTEVNPGNLATLLQSYVTRSDLNLSRDTETSFKTMNRRNNMLNVPVLNIVGEQSSHVDGTITFNMRVNPALCTWMKISDAGMVLEEQPKKIAEAVGLFLQGLGYTLRMGRSRSATVRPNKLALQIKGMINSIYSIQILAFANGVIVWNGMFIHLFETVLCTCHNCRVLSRQKFNRICDCSDCYSSPNDLLKRVNE